MSQPVQRDVAVRATVHGMVQGVWYRDTTRKRALELGVRGWVRNQEDGTVLVHAEGPRDAVDELVGFLEQGPPRARVESVELRPVKVEGHEQFAIRGVSAGKFVVRQSGEGSSRRFELGLEVDGVMRRWLLPKVPSMDPSVKRLAIETDRAQAPDSGTEIAPAEDASNREDEAVWDRGSYEQGGRVPWPEAIDRGHAVFVLHGEKLRGGFALQRTKSQWLLIKRRDEFSIVD